MFGSNSGRDGDNDGDGFSVGLSLTAATTTTNAAASAETTGLSGAGKHKRVLHLGLVVRFCISVKKNRGVSSPEAEAANTTPFSGRRYWFLLGIRIRFIVSLTKVHVGLLLDHVSQAALQPDAEPEEEPDLIKQLSRASSTRSFLAIDISPEIEEEEEEVNWSLEARVELTGSFTRLPGAASARSQHTIGPPEQLPCTRDSVVEAVRERKLSALRSWCGGNSFERVAEVLGSSLEAGIIGIRHDSQQTWKRRVHAKGFFHYLGESCCTPSNLLLLIIAGLSFAIEIPQKGSQYGSYDGSAILAALFLIVAVPTVANFLHARKLHRELMQKKSALKIEVVRGRKPQDVTVADVLVGDLVRLKEGDIVPGDGLFVKGDALVLDDVLSPKVDCHANPFLCYGSKIVKGHGNMLVVSVGVTDGELGKLLNLVTWDPSKKTLLEALVDKPHTYIENLALFVTVLIAIIVLSKFLFKGENNKDDVLTELKGDLPVSKLMRIFESILLRPRGSLRILIGVLTAVVIGTQHGMPFAITLSLSFWNKILMINQVKPQNLSACGTMGRVTAICIDVTGGLLCNQMEVTKFLIGEKNISDDVNCEIDRVTVEALRQGVGVSAVVPEVPERPTIDQIISWAISRRGMYLELSDHRFTVLDHRRLSSDVGVSRILIMKKNEDDEQMMHLHLGGDASTILNLCSQYYDCRGELQSMEDKKRYFEQEIKDMEDTGLTSIAFACKPVDATEVGEDGSRLLAVVGLKRQEETKSAMRGLKNAGVSIILVSEDEPSAVRAISDELGISSPASPPLELQANQILTSIVNMEDMEPVTVVGSCRSRDKLSLVESLKEKGDVVAFFGGLTTSDCPALKEADVGITKKTQSTGLARESSDLIILKEGSLQEVLEFGKCAYHNIQKFTQLQLTACLSGLLINLVAAIASWDTPLAAVQLIWVNFIMCLLGVLKMTMGLRTQEPIGIPPARPRRTQSLITKAMCKDVAIQVFYQASVLLNLHFVGKALPSMNENVWKSLVFNAFMLCQVFNQFNAMKLLRKEVTKVVLSSYWFLSALGTVMIMQVLFVEFVGPLANWERLNIVQWAVSFGIAALSWGFECAVKFIPVVLSNNSQLCFLSRMPWSLFMVVHYPILQLLFLFCIIIFETGDSQATFL